MKGKRNKSKIPKKKIFVAELQKMNLKKYKEDAVNGWSFFWSDVIDLYFKVIDEKRPANLGYPGIIKILVDIIEGQY